MRFDPQANMVSIPEPGQRKRLGPTRLKLSALLFILGVSAVLGYCIVREMGPRSASATDAGSIWDDQPVPTASGFDQMPIYRRSDMPSGSAASTQHDTANSATGVVGDDKATTATSVATATAPTKRVSINDSGRRHSLLAYKQAQDALSSGRPELAVPHFRRAIEIDGEFADAHYGLGLALVLIGDRTRAQMQLKRLAELDPNLANLLKNLIQR